MKLRATISMVVLALASLLLTADWAMPTGG
jgi:hypothetical protein